MQSARARDVIERQVEHLVCLIDDLLDVSRITRDVITLQRQPVLVGAIIARAVETARPAIDGCRHELTLDLPEELLTVDGDKARLVQVIGNILHNAAKFTEPGGRISLSVRREGSSVAISVTDTGIGIPVDQVPKIFELVYPGAREIRKLFRGPRDRPGARAKAGRDARRDRGRAQRRSRSWDRTDGSLAPAG